MKESCGYITFINTGVPDIGCEQYDLNVHIIKPKRATKERRKNPQVAASATPNTSNADYIVSVNTLESIQEIRKQ